jgi:single-strand DNA-binding protein
MNKVILFGRVGSDVKVNKSVSNFSLATNEKYTAKDGEKKEVVMWHNIVCFGKLAEISEKYVKKGIQLIIEGKINYSEYEKDGAKIKVTQIFANELKMVGSNSDKHDSEPKAEVVKDDSPW